MKYLNLGCGARYHENWLNYDFVSNSAFVKETNLTKGIPLDSNTIDFVYHSHVLEHFTKLQGEFFIKECFRVLKSGGVLRVVVPDLEQIAINYLSNLNTVLKDKNEKAIAHYDWSKAELLDQLVREKSGGEMLDIWRQEHLINEGQIAERLGDEFLRIRKNILNTSTSAKIHNKTIKKTFKSELKSFLFKKLNINSENLTVGNFRNGGEVHKWMYDRFSLQELLLNQGFKEVKVVSAYGSDILEWDKYMFLDVEEGKVRKPDSLFMEAKK